MSGGLDSSIAALLLQEMGYEVIGITMKHLDYADFKNSNIQRDYNSYKYIDDAKAIAEKFGFPHHVLDLSKEFEEKIIKNFIDEYLAGRTPNPCVICNKHIKWDALLQKANHLDCEFIATGHYAQVRYENERYILYKGLDETKEQSYVLWGLSQENLKRTIFPLGKLYKNKIKDLARERKCDNLTKKRESFEICFIPDNDYRGFLKKRVKGLENKYENGNIISVEGKILGKHKGFPFYTIGQRRGLIIALGEPMYVINTDVQTNTVVIGTKKDLKKNKMSVKDYNLIKYASLPENIEVITKVRYKDKGTPGIINAHSNLIKVSFNGEVSAIAPGQSAVFYEGDDVVGGGIIV
ncbi:MAG: tRNA 2-thiouridine(34) synthase MnmA [Bacteroidales bacterium]|nr:tRNA 2-thiouridine(34) synthase MnmA [Bacteroidales bacterium]